MIEIVQAGQAGKTSLLFDMHRLRARVFKDRLQWNVDVDDQGLETDQFDLPDAVYLLRLNDQGRVTGSWRLLPSTGPTMIRDVWPQYLESLSLPRAADVYEVSRFAIDCPAADPDDAERQNRQTLAEMFCGLTELCLGAGIREIFTLYDDRIAKVIDRIDCAPYKVSARLPIDGIPCQTGIFRTDAQMLARLRKATGVSGSVLACDELPPALKEAFGARQA